MYTFSITQNLKITTLGIFGVTFIKLYYYTNVQYIIFYPENIVKKRICRNISLTI